MPEPAQGYAGAPVPGLVPLAIGITGHRDLVPGDIPALESAVAGVLRGLRETYPHTPLVLLSSLAEGADRLAARVALRMGVGLIVPLPMPRQLYVQDFRAPASLREFEDLLGRAEKWYEMPLLPDVAEPQVAVYGPERDHQYEAAGLHIARASQILIAMMEHLETPDVLVGGTAQIVSYRLGTKIAAHHASASPAREARQGKMERPIEAPGAICPDSPLDLPDTGPVYLITCRRLKSGLPQGTFLPRCTKTYPPDLADQFEMSPEAHFDGIRAKIDQYNRDVVGWLPQLGSQMAESQRGLVPDDAAARLSPELQQLRVSYAAADALAISSQRTVVQTFRGLFLLAFGAVTCFNIFVYCIITSPYLLLMYPVLLGAAYLCYPPEPVQRWFRGVYRHCDWLPAHSKYLDYRALAEGLRVQFFWRLAGLSDDAGCHYLRRQKSEIYWITEALKNVSLLAREPAAHRPCMAREDALALTRLNWVHNQSEWFAAKVLSQGRRLAAAAAGAKALIGVGVLTAACSGVTLILHPEFRQVRIPGTAVLWTDTVYCVVGLLGVAGMLWLHYLEKLFCGEQVRQYEKMRGLFARADSKMASAPDALPEGAVESILRELGKEALLENADWLLLHRDRPPRVEAQ